MTYIDWLIVIVPTAFVMFVGVWVRKYVRSVADFLSAGRLCGRYVICASDVANALAIITLVTYVEVHYKTGFAIQFWQFIFGPIGMILALSGFCLYRYRETKAMSLGQWLEMRYSRSFRIFAASLRSITEILANSIMPAIAARFFICYLDWPRHFMIYGFEIPTFLLLMVVFLTLAISIICLAGTLGMVITDAVQGLFCFPLIVVFIVFVLYKFDWGREIVPVMMDRAKDESFINPYDVSKLRDFNLFMVVILLYNSVFHRASWIGAGLSSAAKSPHEQKMASILAAWRGQVTAILYVLIGIVIIAFMNHRNFAPGAKEVRDSLTAHISEELIAEPQQRAEFNQAIYALPAQEHQIGVDVPLSQEQNLDTPIFDVAHEKLQEFEGEVEGNDKFKEFRTLFHQEMVAAAMRKILPAGMAGLFMLLMILAMISTDNTRIYSAAVTLSQDVILPLKKKPMTLRQHLWMLRFVSIGIGVFFLIGSSFMAQLDYIQLFVTIICSMWLGGCAPVMIFGLYGRFGNTAGAFTSLITGMVLSLVATLTQRNWANIVYPWLDRNGWVDSVGNFLASVSRPFNPWIVWKMDAVDCPINSYEFYFMISMLTLFLYCLVSKLTQKEPFNLDRMLHRGKYNIDHEIKGTFKWSWRTVMTKILGITKDYTKGDKVIAWVFFLQSFVWAFLGCFVGVIIWNAATPWPLEWWGRYFFVVFMAVPLALTFISVFWFGIGGLRDMFRLFRDLKDRVVNPLDDGRVEGHVSLADKSEFERIEQENPSDEDPTPPQDSV